MKSQLFARAYQVLEEGAPAAECRALIDELEELATAERDELEGTRPPGPARVIYFSDGLARGSEPKHAGGARYQAALDADDDDGELAKVIRRHSELKARAAEIDALRCGLRDRLNEIFD